MTATTVRVSPSRSRLVIGIEGEALAIQGPKQYRLTPGTAMKLANTLVDYAEHIEMNKENAR